MTIETWKQIISSAYNIWIMLKKEPLYFKERGNKLTEENLPSWMCWFTAISLHAISRACVLAVLRVWMFSYSLDGHMLLPLWKMEGCNTSVSQEYQILLSFCRWSRVVMGVMIWVRPMECRSVTCIMCHFGQSLFRSRPVVLNIV